MKKQKGLDEIVSVLLNKNAFQYSSDRFRSMMDGCNERGESIDDYIKDVYTNGELAKASFIENYGAMCRIYSGWIIYGKQFCLDRRDNVVYFISQFTTTDVRLHVHYNPLGVDVFEMGTNGLGLYENEERFQLSQDQQELCDTLDNIIQP